MVLGGNVEKGNITYKSTQICAYADDIVVITRNLKKVILALDFEGKKKMELRINEDKTKSMNMSSAQARRSEFNDR
jgi:hypothetical protein